MSDNAKQSPCKKLKQVYLLSRAPQKLCKSFISDKQHLNFVLGESNEKWFEEATARKLKERELSRFLNSPTVVDSPLPSPSISQLFQTELRVGSSPLLHSSPYSQAQTLTPDLCLTPDLKACWEKPSLGLSPSPISRRKTVPTGLVNITPTAVSSLRLDDSALAWSNSFATPPREQDGVFLESVESTKGKDPARALFSPGGRLNSTTDSLTLLDSTAEENQSGISSYSTSENQSGVFSCGTPDNQSGIFSCGSPDNQPTVTRTVIIDRSETEVENEDDIKTAKSDDNGTQLMTGSVTGKNKREVCSEKTGSIQNFSTGERKVEKWKENFKQRLLERKNSSSSSLTKKLSGVQNKLSQASSEVTPDKQLLEDGNKSPTFSQKFSRKALQLNTKAKTLVDSAVDDILADFFDSPISTACVRKPAPSQKRKSLDTETTACCAVQAENVHSWENNGDTKSKFPCLDDAFNKSLGFDSLSSPKIGNTGVRMKSVLKPILSSDRKLCQSEKKVKFSEVVVEHFSFSERKSVLKTSNETFPTRKKQLLKKSEAGLMLKKKGKIVPYPENSIEVHILSEKTSGQNVVKSEFENEVNPKSALIESSITPNTEPSKVECDKNLMKTKAIDDKNHEGYNSLYVPIDILSSENDIQTNVDITDNMFSQLSQSAVAEMCSAASSSSHKNLDKYQSPSTELKKLSSNISTETESKTATARRFHYPSAASIMKANVSKIFQFEAKSGLNTADRLPLLKPVTHQNVVRDGKIHEQSKSEQGAPEVFELQKSSISREHINKEQTEGDLLDEKSRPSFVDSSMGKPEFYSASGRKISLSTDALQKASKLLKDDIDVENVNVDNEKDKSSVLADIDDEKTVTANIKSSTIVVDTFGDKSLLALGFNEFEDSSQFSQWPDEIVDEVINKEEIFDDNPCFNHDELKCKLAKSTDNLGENLNLDEFEKMKNMKYSSRVANEVTDKFNKDTLIGFSTASGLKIPLSYSAIEKAKQRLNDSESDVCNIEELNVVYLKNNGLEKTNSFLQQNDKDFTKCEKRYEKDFLNKNPEFGKVIHKDDGDSIEDDFLNVIKQAKSIPNPEQLKPLLVSSNSHQPLKIPRFPPGTVVPKGFRPFKPPRLSTKSLPCKDRQVTYPDSVSTSRKDLSKEQTLSSVNDDTSGEVNSAGDAPNCILLFGHGNDLYLLKPEPQDMKRITITSDESVNVDNNREGLVCLEQEDNDACKVPEIKGFGSASRNSMNMKEVAKCLSNQGDFSSVGISEMNGFSTASGKLLHINEDSLANAKGLFDKESDELVKAPKIKGSSTASEKPVNINEDSLTHARGLFDKESDELVKAPKMKGFSTASGKRVNINEDSLTHARGLFDKESDESVKASEMKGFSTASGKRVNINEDSLTHARGLFDKDSDESGEVPEMKGFSTESGKRVNITEDSLTHARGLFDKESDESVKVPGMQGFSTASGKRVNINEDSLTHARGLFDKESDELVKVPGMQGFNTASGKRVNINEDSLTHARGLFDKESDESVKASEMKGFSTASGKRVNINEGSLTHARGLFDKDSDESGEVPEMKGFSTASGKGVYINEDSLTHARGLFDKESDESGEVPEMKGFNTASGKRVNITEISLTHARGLFDKESDESVKVPGMQGFSTASGKRVNINEDSLTHARGLFDKESDDSIKAPKKKGFSTASGKHVIINDDSLTHAKGLFDKKSDESVKTSKIKGFSTASGKRVNINEDSLTHARGLFDKDSNESGEVPEMKGFSTASGKRVNINEDSLTHARGLFDKDSDESGEVPEKKGFNTASGERVKINEDSLIHAKGLFHKKSDESVKVPEMKGFSKASEKCVYIDEESLTHARGLFDKESDESIKVHEMKGFNTAYGKHVNINEDSLTHSRGLFDKESDESVEVSEMKGLVKAYGALVYINEDSLTHEKGVFDKESDQSVDVPQIKGFSTASGKRVNINEDSLTHARGLFDKDSDESVKVPEIKGFSAASGNCVNINEDLVTHARGLFDKDSDESVKVPEIKGFRTASGKRVNINEDSLTHARGLFDKESVASVKVPEMQGLSTASGKHVTINEDSLRHARGLFDKESDASVKVPEMQGLSTASGKHVNINEDSLRHARGLFDKESDESGEVPEMIGFSTASGKRVNINVDSLTHARGLFNKESDESDKVPEMQGFSTALGKPEGINEDSLKHARSLFDNKSNESMMASEMKVFSTASGKSVTLNDDALNHAKNLLNKDSDDSVKFSDIKGLSTTSGKCVFTKDNSSPPARGLFVQENVNSLKMKGFSTSSGKNVSINEHLLIQARAIFEKESNDAVKFCEMNTNSTKSMQCENLNESYLKHSRGQVDTEALDKNIPNIAFKAENSCKIPAIRDIDVDGIIPRCIDIKYRNEPASNSAFEAQHRKRSSPTEFDDSWNGKRQRLESSSLTAELHIASDVQESTRKPLLTGPEGCTTDRRHSGFRPFKPVRTRYLTYEKKRSEDLSTMLSKVSTKPLPTVKPTMTFQTPYKSHVPGQSSSTKPETEATVHKKKTAAPVFLHRGTNSDTDCKVNAETVPGVNKDCSGQGHIRNKSERLAVSNDGTPLSHGENRVLKQDSCADNVFSNLCSSLLMFDEQLSVRNETALKNENITRPGKNSVSKSPNAATETGNVSKSGLAVTVAMETNSVAWGQDGHHISGTMETDAPDPDEFSQDEGDVFYCMLVEARKHQEDIIKKRQSSHIRPMPGRLIEMKERSDRLHLTEVIDWSGQQPVCSVTSQTSESYRFIMADHYGTSTSHALVGDGAYLVPDDAGKLGRHEFYMALLTLEGVDQRLISESWVYNHYRWIVWKLAAYKQASSLLRARCFNPEVVMLQLKYRYDREIDRAERSCLKKIFERDDTPGKRMVLLVAEINQDKGVNSSAEKTARKVSLRLSDGWYGIPAMIDEPMLRLVQAGKIFVGLKLIVSGAELVGGEEACTPLEAPASVMLKLNCNSTRPAPWHYRFGYHIDPRPLCVPLAGLYAEGGAVGVLDVVIVRKYPTMYMEKCVGGEFIFRSSQAEERVRQEYETRKQAEMEKIYASVEKQCEEEHRQEKRLGRRQYSRSAIEELNSGQEIHEAMESAAQPDNVQSCLSERQLALWYEYRLEVEGRRRAEVHAHFQAAWEEHKETFPERQVTPVIKFRVAGCARRDLDSHTNTLLTVWRPSPEVSDLEEGHRYKIYSVNTTASRSKSSSHGVQLTALKQTKFRKMTIDENFLETIYEPRETLTVSEIHQRPPPYGEVDIAGIVVTVTCSMSSSGQPLETVYIADSQCGILAISCWSSLKSYGEDLFQEGRELCCSNLLIRPSNQTSQVAMATVSSELSHITNRPHNADQRRALHKLQTAAKNKKEFIEMAKGRIQEYQTHNTRTVANSMDKHTPKKSIMDQVLEDFGNDSFVVEFEDSDDITANGNVKHMEQADDNKENRIADSVGENLSDKHRANSRMVEETLEKEGTSKSFHSENHSLVEIYHELGQSVNDDHNQMPLNNDDNVQAQAPVHVIENKIDLAEINVKGDGNDCKGKDQKRKSMDNDDDSFTQSIDSKNTTKPEIIDENNDISLENSFIATPVAKRSQAKSKISKLMTYGSPGLLSPLSSTVSRSVSRKFKPPAFKKE
ncbi:uncharacterized protein LOC127876253 isoform X3 [Dreissena polymorpha]|uniref:uncharacterized protein LOC127876253 isoform X3 n=1 Tax=Dreissena polymorpha TaxID=45954 RepID=UPI00226479A3|nr:uncharacterized protein LOC127876253 isoform X3 [Dreissena polymorpha]